MADQPLWRTEPIGALAAEKREFRLVVHGLEKISGGARFLVLRRGTRESPDILLGSGTKEDLRSAMAAAERMAERCAGLNLNRVQFGNRSLAPSGPRRSLVEAIGHRPNHGSQTRRGLTRTQRPS